MIVKVQISLFSSADDPQMLIYNEDKSYFWEMDATHEILELMGDRKKAFFHVNRIVDNIPHIGKEAPHQDW